MLCSKRVLKWLHEGYEGLGGCAGFMKLKFDCMSEAVSSRKAKLTSRKGLSGLKGFRVLDRLGFGGFGLLRVQGLRPFICGVCVSRKNSLQMVCG